MRRLSPIFAIAFSFSLLTASIALLLLNRPAKTSLGWIQWSALQWRYDSYCESTGLVHVPIALPRQIASVSPLLRDMPPLPPDPPVEPPLVDSFLEQLGNHEGGGVGINSAPGKKPMESPFADPEHAHEQPMLSRDPQGPGPLLTTPSLSLVVPGQNGGGGLDLIKLRTDELAMKLPQTHHPTPKPSPQQQPLQQPAAHATPPVPPNNAALPPTPAPTPSKTAAPVLQPPAPNKTIIAVGPLPSTTKPTPKTGELVSAKPAEEPTRPQTQPTVAAKPTPPRAVPPVTLAMATPASPSDPSSPPPADLTDAGVPGTFGAPGPDFAAADPAPQSDMESFAVVAKNPNLRMTPGYTKSQLGRRWKPKELPRLDVAAWDHIRMSMEDVYVVLELRTDADGNVTRVRVVHGSGSDAIDMPCQRAAYTWWFEPPVDKKTKKPQSDVFLFSIVFF